MQELFEISGKLDYSVVAGGFRLVADMDVKFAHYYYSLLPKYLRVVKTGYSPHVTIVRFRIDSPVLDNWGKRQGQIVKMMYWPVIRNDEKFFWLDMFSLELEEIRQELRLPLPGQRKPSNPMYLRTFHMTLGKLGS